MVTMVGTSSDFNTVLKDLITLEYDAIEGYKAAVEKLENAEFKTKLSEFLQDHYGHIKNLSALARTLGLEPPTEPGAKQLLTEGKVRMGALIGDKSILTAMKTNEEDTNTAYERAFNHAGLPAEARDIINQNWGDERRHRAYITDAIMRDAAAA